MDLFAASIFRIIDLGNEDDSFFLAPILKNWEILSRVGGVMVGSLVGWSYIYVKVEDD